MQNKDFKTAGAALEKDHEITVLTTGCSMQPMLRRHRDIAVIKRPDRPLKKGDVVLYPGKQGEFILHRIVSLNGGDYIIRGDNNYFTECDVTPESIVGILKEFYREGKYINCETDKKYKLYSFYILHSYGPRYFWKKMVKPAFFKTGGKILRFLKLKK